MRIAVVIDFYYDLSNGTAVSARRFVDALKQRGHTINVITCNDGPDEEPAEGIHYVREQTLSIFQPILDKQRVKLAKADKEVFREVFAKSDIVHIYLSMPFGFAAARTAHEMGKPLLVAFHLHPGNVSNNIGLGWMPGLDRLMFGLLKRKYYRYATDVHCPTEFTKRELDKYGINNVEKHVISNGYDSTRYYPMPDVTRPKEWDGKFVVAYVGRLAREKRPDVLIRAVAHSPHKDKIKLIIAGTGPLKARMQKLAHKLKVDAEFGFYSQQDLAIMLNRSDIYVHCAQVEVESISCMEAFATGLVPVIGDAKKSATKYFALDKRSVFRNGKFRELSEKINYWLEHPEELARMSQAYAVHAQDNFRLELSIDKIEQLYKYVINKNRVLNANFSGKGQIIEITDPKPLA